MKNPMDYPNVFRFIINSWPPYLGAAIVVKYIADDWQRIEVGMKLRWYNRNYVKSHFGGSLFSMTDPFYMLMLLRNLGKDYIVWDTAARIKFIQPGRSEVRATFALDAERLQSIREKAESSEKLLEKFKVRVVDGEGKTVAVVQKTLYIRKKS